MWVTSLGIMFPTWQLQNQENDAPQHIHPPDAEMGLKNRILMQVIILWEENLILE